MRRGEVNRRLNSEYYHPERMRAISQICEKWDKQNRAALGEVLNFGEAIRPYNAALPYIGLANVESEFGSYIATDEEEPEGTCRIFERRQVLYGKLRPYLNKVYITQESGQCSTEFYCLSTKDSAELLPPFLAGFLMSQPFLSQTIHMMTGNTHPRIQLQDFKEILIPLPPLDIQRKLVSDLEAAHEARKRRLTEADALLAGIDRYLLEKLGLRLPEKEERRTYAVRLKAINTNRFDSHFHTPFFRKTEEVIRSLKFKHVELSALLQMPPLNGIDARDYLEAGQRYLRVQNVRPYKLLMDDVKYVSSDSKKDVTLKSGDVLLTRKGTFGVAASVPKEAEDCLISSEIMLLRLSPDAACLSEYLMTWLNSSAAKILLDRYKTGGIMGHITQDVVSAFPVPVPPMEIQKSIAAEITRRRGEARRLRAEAAKEWEEVKARFEKQLLG